MLTITNTYKLIHILSTFYHVYYTTSVYCMFHFYVILRNSTSASSSWWFCRSLWRQILAHTDVVGGEKSPSGSDVDLPALVLHQSMPDKPC